MTTDKDSGNKGEVRPLPNKSGTLEEKIDEEKDEDLMDATEESSSKESS